MNDRTLLKSFIDVKSTPKNLRDAERRTQFVNPDVFSLKGILYGVKIKLTSIYYKIAHILYCPEENLTQPDFIRYCHKCRRFTISDKDLRKAYRAGGMNKLLEVRIEKGRLSKLNSPPQRA